MSNYSTSFQGNKVITRRTAFQYAQVNTRIPFYVESIAAEAFQKRGVIQTIQFPSALSHIGARAFRSCNSLKGLSLPENMTEIGSAAFADCSSMRRATIPASVDELPRDLFSENIKLSTVEFHGKDRLQMIHKNAFFRCQSLTSLVLPETVIEIGDRAFYRCKSLGSDLPSGRAEGDRQRSLLFLWNSDTATAEFTGNTGSECLFQVQQSEVCLSPAQCALHRKMGLPRM